MSAISPRILSYDETVASYNVLSIISPSQPVFKVGKKVKIPPFFFTLGTESRLKHLGKDIFGKVCYYLVDKRQTQFRELQTNSPFDSNGSHFDPSFENLRVSFKEYNSTQAALKELKQATNPICSSIMAQKIDDIMKKNHANIFWKFLNKVEMTLFLIGLPPMVLECDIYHTLEGYSDANIHYRLDSDLKSISLRIGKTYHQIIGPDYIDYLACKTIINLFREKRAKHGLNNTYSFV